MYEVDVFKENVVMGNDALMKCQIPSLVSDLISVDNWVDSKANELLKSDDYGNFVLHYKYWQQHGFPRLSFT